MIELKRQFYDFLVGWKADKKQECLLVKGARQIGKTFIIEKFGRENYESFIEINFIEEPEFASVFAFALAKSRAASTVQPSNSPERPRLP